MDSSMALFYTRSKYTRNNIFSMASNKVLLILNSFDSHLAMSPLLSQIRLPSIEHLRLIWRIRCLSNETLHLILNRCGVIFVPAIEFLVQSDEDTGSQCILLICNYFGNSNITLITLITLKPIPHHYCHPVEPPQKPSSWWTRTPNCTVDRTGTLPRSY